MSHHTFDRSDFKPVIIAMLIGALVGYSYTFLVYTSQEGAQGSVWMGIAIGVVISGLSSSFESLFVGEPSSKIRSMPFLYSLIIRMIVHTTIILITILCVQYIYFVLTGIQILEENNLSSLLTDIGFSFVFLGIIIFIFQMRNFIGGKTLTSLVLGRYNSPQVEQRIFMVLDVVGSTSAAQKIGDTNFHKFLNELFILMDQPIHKFDGEIHSYVGDAILAVWPLDKSPEKNERIFKAIQSIQQICILNQNAMLEKFNVLPEISISVHAGPVAIGETGHRKRQITYLGNALNLTFRLEGVAKKEGLPSRFIISDNLLKSCQLPSGLKAVSIGAHRVKGVDEPINLSALLL